MMKHYLLALLCFLSGILQAQTPDFSLVGFATLNGGTTGGQGGQVVNPANFDELRKYVEDKKTPYIIVVDKEFNTGVSAFVDPDGSIVAQNAPGAIPTTFGAQLKVGSNKTIIGIGNKAFFNRIGLSVQCESNIIVRNIKFSMLNVPATRFDEYKILDTDGVSVVGDPDCICIQADAESVPEDRRICRNVWIDHCEFYNENIENKDRYDGLVDTKNDVKYITISWCYFHNHSKAMLSGKGNKDNFNRMITYHHNYFSNINGSRLPMLRYGQHHYFNNFMESCNGDGLDLRVNSNGYIEGNYFKDSKKPVSGKMSENGQGVLVDNIFENCERLHKGVSNLNNASSNPLSAGEEFRDSCNFKPSDFYAYSAQLTKTVDVPFVVKTYSGVGKIDVDPVTNSVKVAKSEVPSKPGCCLFRKCTEKKK